MATSGGSAFVPSADSYGSSGYGGGYTDEGSTGGSSSGSTYVNSYFPNPAAPSNAGTTAEPPANYNVTGVSSRLAILVSISLLVAAAIRWPAPVEGWFTRDHRLLLSAGVLAALGYAALAFLAPWLVPAVLVESAVVSTGVTVAVAVMGLAAAARFAMSYRFSGIQLHGATAIGAVMLVEAQLSVEFGVTWSGTSWLYHVQLLAEFTAMFGG